MLDQEARELLVKTYDEIRDANKVAAIYGISSWTVYFYVKKAREGKSLEVRTSERGRKAKLTEQDKEAIKNCILESCKQKSIGSEQNSQKIHDANSWRKSV